MHVEDLGEIAAVCEMCETQEIRYVHYMEHDEYPGELAVGCRCAEHMESDYAGPRRREQKLKNAARRRSRWLSRQWNMSRNGNAYINTDGFNITIFRNSNGTWGGKITDDESGQSIRSRRTYESQDRAKLAAFDAMIFLKATRGWGH